MDANTEKEEQRQKTKEMLPKYQRSLYNNVLGALATLCVKSGAELKRKYLPGY